VAMVKLAMADAQIPVFVVHLQVGVAKQPHIASGQLVEMALLGTANVAVPICVVLLRDGVVKPLHIALKRNFESRKNRLYLHISQDNIFGQRDLRTFLSMDVDGHILKGNITKPSNNTACLNLTMSNEMFKIFALACKNMDLV